MGSLPPAPQPPARLHEPRRDGSRPLHESGVGSSVLRKTPRPLTPGQVHPLCGTPPSQIAICSAVLPGKAASQMAAAGSSLSHRTTCLHKGIPVTLSPCHLPAGGPSSIPATSPPARPFQLTVPEPRPDQWPPRRALPLPRPLVRRLPLLKPDLESFPLSLCTRCSLCFVAIPSSHPSSPSSRLSHRLLWDGDFHCHSEWARHRVRLLKSSPWLSKET